VDYLRISRKGDIFHVTEVSKKDYERGIYHQIHNLDSQNFCIFVKESEVSYRLVRGVWEFKVSSVSRIRPSKRMTLNSDGLDRAIKRHNLSPGDWEKVKTIFGSYYILTVDYLERPLYTMFKIPQDRVVSQQFSSEEQ